MKNLSIKQKKEIAQKKALLRRITDVYSGAQGAEWDMEWDIATANILEHVVNVFMTMFDADDRDYLWKPHCLSYYDNPQKACEFLYEAGIRA